MSLKFFHYIANKGKLSLSIPSFLRQGASSSLFKKNIGFIDAKGFGKYIDQL